MSMQVSDIEALQCEPYCHLHDKRIVMMTEDEVKIDNDFQGWITISGHDFKVPEDLHTSRTPSVIAKEAIAFTNFGSVDAGDLYSYAYGNMDKSVLW